MDTWAEIDLLERDPVAQDALLREALLSQPDVPASVRILASLETQSVATLVRTLEASWRVVRHG